MRMKFQKLESYIRIDQDQEGQRGPDGSSQLRQRKESFESWMTIEPPLKKKNKNKFQESSQMDGGNNRNTYFLALAGR